MKTTFLNWLRTIVRLLGFKVKTDKNDALHNTEATPQSKEQMPPKMPRWFLRGRAYQSGPFSSSRYAEFLESEEDN